ncbi:biotin-dependent carboxyltransferase family protein [Rhodococcus koreensis]|uniref:5-oxoprolinase subunit C family protein n=1 Tax=Rhodococcus koreensis TaxID=99653 RepID=UPI00197D998C|nr:biotin-dependent carboxyltransferase family protein [Rhodococcus koreensis]QSE82023.1 biotin-dependent carboxyltransferase family protein [Rhodococcus koreensis]
MAWLEVVRTGPFTTVQDRGRPGYASIGVGESGAADREAHDSANRLVGNHSGAATLEVTLGGLAVRATGTVSVAVTGARNPVTVNSEPRPDYTMLHLNTGDLLEIAFATEGLRSYVAVRGGFDVPAVMGSRSTDTLSGLGPDPVAEGDRLLVGADAGDWPADEIIPPPVTPEDPLTMRVRLGPRDDWFTPASVDALLRETWTVSSDTNRVGARLEGPGALHRSVRDEMPSEAMVAGALQVPPNGQPILFLADHPVTGGYPVIAVVAEADLPMAAQLRPGHRVRFHRVVTSPIPK